MPEQHNIDYWDERGRTSYEYRGERFYTVTPILLYWHRRRRLLELLEQELANPAVDTVCDFGCGDGFYTSHFSTRFPLKTIVGCDVSPAMIDAAQSRYEPSRFAHAPNGIPFTQRFDLVYCVAVLAHIVNEEELGVALADIRSRLHEGGTLAIFESVADEARSGATWSRRTESEYERVITGAGFILRSSQRVTYPLFNYFESTIYHHLAHMLYPGLSRHDQCLRANSSKLFRTIQSIVMGVDRLVDPLLPIGREGNCLMTFQRSS